MLWHDRISNPKKILDVEVVPEQKFRQCLIVDAVFIFSRYPFIKHDRDIPD
jgi:hypothetical protein